MSKTVNFEEIKDKANEKSFIGECYRLYRNLKDDGLVDVGADNFPKIHAFLHGQRYHLTEPQFWFTVRVLVFRFGDESYMNDLLNSLTKENKREYGLIHSECPKSLEYSWFGECGVTNMVRKDKSNNDSRVKITLKGKKKLFSPERIK